MVIYLLQVSACTGVFFLFYKAFLSRLTFYSLSRWYLLGALVVSFVVPFTAVPAGREARIIVIQQFGSETLGEGRNRTDVAAHTKRAPSTAFFAWSDIILAVYFVVAGIFCTKLIVSLMIIWVRLKGRERVVISGVEVLTGAGKLGNGSFFDRIFINRAGLTDGEVKMILQHEQTHVRLFHSYDKLLSQISQSVLWFNPFSYLYTRAIAENHEFEVDQLVTKGGEKSVYAELVLLLSRQNSKSLVNEFSMSPAKRRITHLFKQPSDNMRKLTYVSVLPLVVLCCIAFGRKAETPVVIKKVVPEEVKRRHGSLFADTPDNLPKSGGARRIQKEALHRGTAAIDSTTTNGIDGLKFYASDSVRLSKDGKIISLYGHAVVEYLQGLTAVKLIAATIQIDRDRLIVSAKGERQDAADRAYKGKAKMFLFRTGEDKPRFEDISDAQLKAGDQQMEADTITLNLQSLKGKAVGM